MNKSWGTNVWGFHYGSVGKEFTCNAGNIGDVSSTSGLGRSPGGGKWQPTPPFLPEKSHGQKSLVGYCPRVPKSQTQLSD